MNNEQVFFEKTKFITTTTSIIHMDTQYTPILTIYYPDIIDGKAHDRVAYLRRLLIGGGGSKTIDGEGLMRLLRNATISGGNVATTGVTANNNRQSSMTRTLGGTTTSRGEVILVSSFSASNPLDVVLDEHDIMIQPGDYITIEMLFSKRHTNATVTMFWDEFI